MSLPDLSPTDRPVTVRIDSGPARRPTFGVALIALRISVTLQTVATIWQPIVIGRYLDGDYAALQLHAIGAIAVELSALVTAIVAMWFSILIRRGWVVLVQIVLLFLLVGMQAGFGYTRNLGGHIPVGVTVVGLTVLMLWWVWSRAGRAAPRPPRTDRARGRRPNGADA